MGEKFKFRIVSLVGTVTLLTSLAYAQDSTIDKYVTTETLNVRLCSTTQCPVTNRLYRGDFISVYEISGDWARVSKYYDSSAERIEFPSLLEKDVARWVWAGFLSDIKPDGAKELKANAKYFDPRIKGIPKPGEYGLTVDEVLLMRKYAYGMMKTKQCRGIEYADKSTNKANTYYVNCSGEMRNRFFVARDVKVDW